MSISDYCLSEGWPWKVKKQLSGVKFDILYLYSATFTRRTDKQEKAHVMGLSFTPFSSLQLQYHLQCLVSLRMFTESTLTFSSFKVKISVTTDLVQNNCMNALLLSYQC